MIDSDCALGGVDLSPRLHHAHHAVFPDFVEDLKTFERPGAGLVFHILEMGSVIRCQLKLPFPTFIST